VIDTFYLHLEFSGKSGGWSINLPFLCTKCGACCTLEDFLTAGEINGKPDEYPEVHAKIKALFEELGKMWEANEAKYDDYTVQTPCPFLINNACSIYEIRPDGCRLFPKTAFGMQTQNCPPLTRFKKQRNALKKGKNHKETYHFIGTIPGSTKSDESIKLTKFSEKQYRVCVAKLHQVGMTDEELAFFNYFNEKKKNNLLVSPEMCKTTVGALYGLCASASMRIIPT
jgi:Fe-S-cluster containining protein